jgi:hypothetical protein
MLLAGAHDDGDDVVDAVLRTDGRSFGFHHLRHGVECQRIALVGLAQRADPQRRDVEQLDADVVERARIAGLQLELDLGERLALLACLDRSLVEGDFDLRAAECQPLRTPADPGRKHRRKLVRGQREGGMDLRRQAREIRRRAVDRRLPFLPHEGRLVADRELQGLDVAGAVAPHAQRAALARQRPIRRVVVDGVQPSDHAAVARVLHDHRGLADLLDRRGRRAQLQLDFGVGAQAGALRASRDVGSGLCGGLLVHATLRLWVV